MRIESLALALPSRVVPNEEIIGLIAAESTALEQRVLGTALERVRRNLSRSGARTRHLLGTGESPVALTAQVCREAISQLDGDKHVDLLIDASVYLHLIEPASANLIAHESGLDRVPCFDLRAACDSWMKAASIASSLIEGGEMRRIMIVNGDFGLVRGGPIYPELFALSDLEQLRWRFPSFTIGEAAAATILGPDPENRWRFHNKTRNNLWDLCTITGPWHAAYPLASARVAPDGPGLFTSHGVDLRREGFTLAVETFREAGIQPTEVDVLLSHCSSWADWLAAATQVGLSEKLYDIYARCGNVVSVAIPAAIALAEKDGSLNRGQRVAAWVASAGMSCSTATFRY